MSDTITRLRERLGGDVVLHPADADLARHLDDFTYHCADQSVILAVAYPRSTEQVSDILRICHEDGVKVTPQGGMTGLAGGGVPVVPSIVLSLERMRVIEEIDRAASTMTVQAGVPLQRVQEAADEAGLFFPVDLGGRGSCQIGGNAATNAGGNRVLRYGMMRQVILGVEAVLADGTVISSLCKMIKNNAGYDLKQLFIGTEGTLGIVTRLTLRLFPKARSLSTGLCAVADYDRLLALLDRAKSGFGADLSAFEAMWPDFYRLGTAGLDRAPPVPFGHGIYALIETMGTDPETDQARFESVIGEALEAGIVEDAVVAQSVKETQNLWAIRDCPGEFTKVFWPQLSFDVSLPTGQLGDFVDLLTGRLASRWPDARALFFGHIADGNLHLSFKTAEDPMPVHAIDEVVYEAVGEWHGSISAEHGIGLGKREFLHHSRSPAEIALMRTLKTALDPKGILNPQKIF